MKCILLSLSLLFILFLYKNVRLEKADASNCSNNFNYSRLFDFSFKDKIFYFV